MTRESHALHINEKLQTEDVEVDRLYEISRGRRIC